MKRSIALLCLCAVLGLTRCATPPAGAETPGNPDKFVGFCVMPMEIVPPDFAPRYSYEQEGYFRPHPDANRQDFHNTKWPASCIVSVGSDVYGSDDCAYEYTIRIDPKRTGDTFYSFLRLYEGADGVIYDQPLGSVFCLPLGCSAEQSGCFRIDTGNGLTCEHFYYTVRFVYGGGAERSAQA